MEQKRFPADTVLSYQTFLNDKKINGELYALMQRYSKYEVLDKDKNKFRTYVMKKDLPSQKVIMEALDIKSPKTLKTHINYLLEQGYIVEGDKCYDLPEKEDIYFLIPLETLQYLNDNCKEHVIKIYIYLGQRYKMVEKEDRDYVFTLEEIGEHIGIAVKNHSAGYRVVKNALDLLQNSGLIDYVGYFDGVSQKKKLREFSFEYHKNGCKNI